MHLGECIGYLCVCQDASQSWWTAVTRWRPDVSILGTYSFPRSVQLKLAAAPDSICLCDLRHLLPRNCLVLPPTYLYIIILTRIISLLSSSFIGCFVLARCLMKFMYETCQHVDDQQNQWRLLTHDEILICSYLTGTCWFSRCLPTWDFASLFFPWYSRRTLDSCLWCQTDDKLLYNTCWNYFHCPFDKLTTRARCRSFSVSHLIVLSTMDSRTGKSSISIFHNNVDLHVTLHFHPTGTTRCICLSSIFRTKQHK
jgi:hypothetical protein